MLQFPTVLGKHNYYSCLSFCLSCLLKWWSLWGRKCLLFSVYTANKNWIFIVIWNSYWSYGATSCLHLIVGCFMSVAWSFQWDILLNSLLYEGNLAKGKPSTGFSGYLCTLAHFLLFCIALRQCFGLWGKVFKYPFNIAKNIALFIFGVPGKSNSWHLLETTLSG